MRFALAFYWLVMTVVWSADLTESRPVSYLFEESPGEAIVQMSRPVSYLYVDALPENLVRSQSSAPISYFYNRGLQAGEFQITGSVFDREMRTLPNATVTVGIGGKVIHAVQTDGEGKYRFPPLASGLYDLFAETATLRPEGRTVPLIDKTVVQNFQLVVNRVTPQTTSVGVEKAEEVGRSESAPEELRVFRNGLFEKVNEQNKLDPNKMTVVMTHGWNSSSENWPTTMATALSSRGWADYANIVAWHWEKGAQGGSPGDKPTARVGQALAEALYRELSADYQGNLHFVGHSLGTLVNAAAANQLHRETEEGQSPLIVTGWSSDRTHMTLLDQAEIARLVNSDVLYVGGKAFQITYKYSQDLKLSLAIAAIAGGVTAAQDWQQPLPRSFLWADNYISLVGQYECRALNVLLQRGVEIKGDEFDELSLEEVITFLKDVHGYAYEWYADTVRSPNLTFAGFRNSFEYQERFSSLFPPNGQTDPSPIYLYRQQPAPADPIKLERYSWMLCPENLSLTVDNLVSSITSFSVDRAMERFVEPAIEGLGNGVEFFGDVIVETGEIWKDGAAGARNGIDYLTDVTKARVRALKPDLGVRLTLRSGGGGGDTLRAAAISTNSGAIAWFTLALPPTVSMMSFEYSASGQAGKDQIVFGTGQTNLFSLEGKYVPKEQRYSSGVIDVSAFAGQTNQFFFGLVGNTSDGCSVTIDSIRFYNLSVPELSVAVNAGVLVISWPNHNPDYVLESAPAIAGSDWETVSDPPTIFGGAYRAEFPLADTVRFFRLAHEP